MCIGRSIKVIFGIKTLQWRKTLKSFCQTLKRRISVVSLAKKVKCKTEKRRSSCVATGVTQGPAVRSPLLLRKFCNEKKKKTPKTPPPYLSFSCLVFFPLFYLQVCRERRRRTHVCAMRFVSAPAAGVPGSRNEFMVRQEQILHRYILSLMSKGYKYYGVVFLLQMSVPL